ncbi:hypothetical protein [Psychrobacter sanguinis]|uniref:hypothetical protein n=1 Tax=Psychrobacter sanguinis TaxID=861445 RepID=UPI002A763AC9|nr:hypothetical protein [Psychrobacter sanguinis]MDY3306750.1 hypothetical protein [Psychrobacter sanguinis]
MTISVEDFLSVDANFIEIDNLTYKEKKKFIKKLKKMLKELEFLKRTGGLTVIVGSESVITTYHNNSLDREKIFNNRKVTY